VIGPADLVILVYKCLSYWTDYELTNFVVILIFVCIMYTKNMDFLYTWLGDDAYISLYFEISLVHFIEIGS